MVIRIKNLRLRTIIGVNDWERENEQDVIINVEMHFDGKKAAETDSLDFTVNYKEIKDKIVDEVRNSRYFLLEKLVDRVLTLVFEDSQVNYAWVEVEKPHALRFADSVSVSDSRSS